MADYQMFELGDVVLQSQQTIRNAKMAYKTYGTLNAARDNAIVYPRQVVKRALDYNAAALILCHNHPSGSAEPSIADRKLTRVLQKTLEMVDVRVLDHIIVGEGDPLSMAEYGWM